MAKSPKKPEKDEDWPEWLRRNDYDANIVSSPPLISPSVAMGESFVRSLFAEERKHTPTIERRCVADVMKKQGRDMSGAFAICRASMQKAGNYKKGSADLTKKGAAKSASKSRAKDDPAKFKYFEKQVKAARQD
jgi:hypothetical protein